MAGCSPRMKKAMGGAVMEKMPGRMPAFPGRPGGRPTGPMTRPGFMVKPARPMGMKKGGMVGGAGSGVGREMKSMGKGVRRKGSCGKNS